MELIREIEEKYVIKEAKDTERYLKEFSNLDREYFIVLGLDTASKVLFREVTAIGTLNACIIHPREVFKNAIVKSVNSIIIAHNHPSGSNSPSKEDKDIYNKLKEAGEILQIKVLDSVIITKHKITSLNDDEN